MSHNPLFSHNTNVNLATFDETSNKINYPNTFKSPLGFTKSYTYANQTEYYGYNDDSNGNRQSATVNGTTTTASYTLDDNLIVYGDNTYSYDDDGYLQEKVTPQGSTTYTYGTLGELLEVTTPTKTITYTHNANNQRVAKLIDGIVTEKYLWADLTTLLAVYDANDTLKQRFEYVNDRMPISMTDENNIKYYLHYDQVGTLKAISDINGNIVKTMTYDTFGNVLTDSNPSFKVPFGFAGGLYDTDTKLTRFGYRDYDAYTGKWTAKDPIGFDGGDSNLYGYVLGNPVNWIDESGLTGIAIPFTPTISPLTIFPTLGAGLVYESAKLGYQTGYDLAEWWDNYNDSSVTDGLVCKAEKKERSPYPPAKRKKYPSKKEAREAAQRAGKGKKPIHHPDGSHGPHYHPDVPKPKGWTPKSPNPHDHYNYPKGQ